MRQEPACLAAAPRRTQPQAERQSDSDGAFLMAPIATTSALMSAPAHLGGIPNPMTNLVAFPNALVNEDVSLRPVGLSDGLVSGLDKNKFDVRVVSPDEARRLLGHRGVRLGADTADLLVAATGLGRGAVTANSALAPARDHDLSELRGRARWQLASPARR